MGRWRRTLMPPEGLETRTPTCLEVVKSLERQAAVL